MKIKKQHFSKRTTIIFLFITILFFLISFIAQLRPKQISDVTVELSLLAMKKGYQGVTRTNSGERSYSSADYLKRLLISPKNLRHIDFTSIDKLFLEMPFDSELTLEQEINNSLSFGRSNQRNDLDIKAQISDSLNERINVEINLKGNGLDHIQYRKKESIRITVDEGMYQGMSEFSVQHPMVRDFQLEPIFLKITNDYGIISTNLKLIRLYINGESRGVFEIEEVGSKEHLLKSGRKNSVVIRFEAERYRSLIGSTVTSSGRAVTYRSSTFDSLNTTKIQKDKTLRDYEIVAKGMIRKFLDGNLEPSEVFDPVLMGRYLGISETLGITHPLIFHNFLFYYNPDTKLLEPIAYDAMLSQRFVHSSLITNITDGFVEELLYDELIYKNYRDTIYELSNKLVNDNFFLDELKDIEQQWYGHLVKEYWLLEKIDFEDLLIRPKSMLEKNEDSLKKKSNRKKMSNQFLTSCSESEELQNKSNNNINAKLNSHELIKSEYYKIDECAIIKIWATSFDYPKDGKFPEDSYCGININLDECNYEYIQLHAIELIDGQNSEFYPIETLINLEYSAMYNFGFPEQPKYKVFNTLNTPDAIKIYYKDLITKNIVFVFSDLISMNK